MELKQAAKCRVQNLQSTSLDPTVVARPPTETLSFGMISWPTVTCWWSSYPNYLRIFSLVLEEEHCCCCGS